MQSRQTDNAFFRILAVWQIVSCAYVSKVLATVISTLNNYRCKADTQANIDLRDF